MMTPRLIPLFCFVVCLLGMYFHFHPQLTFSLFYGDQEFGAHFCRANEPFEALVVGACIFFMTGIAHCYPIVSNSKEFSSQKKAVSFSGVVISFLTLATYLLEMKNEITICNSDGLPIRLNRIFLWMATTPLQIYLVSLFQVNSKPPIGAMFADLLMLVFGLLGRVYCEYYPIFFSLGSLMFLYVCKTMNDLFVAARSNSVLANDQQMLFQLHVLTFLVWLMFPVIELATFVDYLDTHTGQFLLIVAEITAKGAYSYVLVKGNFFVLDDLASAPEIVSEEILTDPKRSSNLMELTARILTLAAQHQGDAENLNRSMLAQLSHELRTPLNDVIDFNTLLLEAAEPEKRNLVEGSLNSARTLRDVIDNVLLSSKMQADGTRKKKISKFVIGDLVDEVVETLFQKASNRVPLIMDIDLELLQTTVLGDMYQIRIILLNLLDNAIKFSYGGMGSFALLRMRVVERGESNFVVDVNVIDNGIGMTQEFQEILFATDQKTSFTGLRVVKLYADLLGAHLRCESRKSEGTEISLSLPFESYEVRPVNKKSSEHFKSIQPIILSSIQPLATVIAQHLNTFGFNQALEVVTSKGGWETKFFRYLQEIKNFGMPIILVGELSVLEEHLPIIQVLFETEHLRILILSDENVVEESKIHPYLRQDYVVCPVSFRPSVFFETLESMEKDLTRLLTRMGRYTLSEGEHLPVLLVEDNQMNIKVTTLLLRRLSLIFEVAQSGLESVELVASGKDFGLILMDLNMPGMDGVEATKRIRVMERRGQTARRHLIYSLSAVSLHDVQEMCQGAEIDGFLTKPIRMKDLRRICRRAKREFHFTHKH